MAREEDDDALPPIGEDTPKFLEEVKKGKPRSFLLICKGVKLKYLLVKKKPIKKSDIADAKKLGYKGDAYIGVITGKGMDLVFNLAVADGFESEPCKEKTLKDFLEEHAEFKAKPSFAIVATQPAIPFDDEDLNHPVIARFLALGELITQVLDAKPDLNSDIEPSVNEIRLLLQDANFNEATPKIDVLEAKLNGWLSNDPPSNSNNDSIPPAPPPPPTQQPPAQNSDALRAKLEEALNKLVPQLKQAVATFPERKVELLTPVAAIKKQLESGALQEARTGILQVGQSLKSILVSQGNQNSPPQPNATTSSPTTNQPNELAAQYQKLLDEIEPKFQNALKQQLGDTSKFRTVMAYAVEQAANGGFENAMKALERLGLAIDKAVEVGVRETDAIPADIVATRKKFLLSRWQQALQLAADEVRKLEKPIAELVPDEDPEELIDGIIESIEDLADRMNDAILGAQSATAGNTKPLEQAVAIIRDYRKKLPGMGLITLLESAKQSLGIDIGVRKTLQDALDELEAKLAN